jgi:hypothetical protein
MENTKILNYNEISIDQNELNKIFFELEFNLDNLLVNNLENEIKPKKIQIIKLPKISSNSNKAKSKLLNLLKKKC